MADTYTILRERGEDGSGNLKRVVATIVFNSSYSSGLSVDKAQLGFESYVDYLVVLGETTATPNFYKYDKTNNKIIVYQQLSQTYSEFSGTFTGTLQVLAVGA